MTREASYTLPFFLCLLWLSVLGGGWASASRAAELPLAPVQDTLADHGAARMRAIDTPLAQDVWFGVPLQTVVPVGATGTDERQRRVLVAVPPVLSAGFTPDTFGGALEPVDSLGSGAGRPDVQSLKPASAQESAPIQRQR
jgi:hypothetical protein